jgi:hypothetical protein
MKKSPSGRDFLGSLFFVCGACGVESGLVVVNDAINESRILWSHHHNFHSIAVFILIQFNLLTPSAECGHEISSIYVSDTNKEGFILLFGRTVLERF